MHKNNIVDKIYEIANDYYESSLGIQIPFSKSDFVKSFLSDTIAKESLYLRAKFILKKHFPKLFSLLKKIFKK